MTQTPTLLRVENLHVGFTSDGRQTTAVDGVSFDVPEGKTLGLVGESGSGKSVSALSVLGLLPYPAAFHNSGHIMFDGDDIMGADTRVLQKLRGNDISMIFQEPMSSLNPLHDIEKQISEVIQLHRGLSRKAARDETCALLERVGIPDPESRLGALPHELSGGQRQRVMIAMALANRPRLLIADEPTTALDVTIQKQILDLLRDLQRENGMAILLITHDLGVVRKMADRICVMQEGQMVENDESHAIFEKPAHAYTKKLIAAEPSGAPEPLKANPPEIVSGENVKVWFPIRQGLLRRAQTHVKAVNDISLTVRRGETLGIVGESGSGKTTLGRAMIGLQRAEGSITINGTNLSGASPAARRAMRKHMQIVFQDPYGALSPRLPVADIIGEGLAIHEPELTSAVRIGRVRDILEDVELDPDIAGRYPHEFSGGQRQRIAIARALVLNPEFIILDEPTSALDRSVQAQIIELLRRLQTERGLTYLFISHDLKVVRALAHRVLVMQNGVAVELGPTQQIFEAPASPYTKTLIEAAFA
ncbi:MAG: ABC transporter ATP-binding protein [Pseudomonadota bacterium]|nr:ABC transporter ATP-binding protein [Pseudomonadota bacterium]